MVKKHKILFKFKWEYLLIIIFIIINIINTIMSPYYLNVNNLFEMTFIFIEKGLVALTMLFIIIIGEIDISVASNMALSAVVMATCYKYGMNIWIAVLIGLITGTAGGFLNGIIITKIKLPSIIITLATYSLFRGLAYVILGDEAVFGFPESFSYLGRGTIGNSRVPFVLAFFIIISIIFGIILGKKKYGRQLYAIGLNSKVCYLAGISVDKIRLFLFIISGFMSALAGIFIASRVGNVRPNIATGFELEIITIVLIGGASIKGGSGTVIGAVLSLFIIGAMRYGLLLKNVSAQMMLVIIGSLLIGIVLISNLIGRRFKAIGS